MPLSDNFSGHDYFPYLPGVTYWYLPAETTALFQPMDQGIIVTLKTSFRAILVRELIESLQYIERDIQAGGEQASYAADRAGVREGRKAHVSDAIRIVRKAWDRITSEEIANCWRRSTCTRAPQDSPSPGLSANL